MRMRTTAPYFFFVLLLTLAGCMGEPSQYVPEKPVPRGEILAEDAPDWVRDEVGFLKQCYGAPYDSQINEAVYGWGTCSFQGQAGDCLWVNYTDQNGSRILSFNQPFPEELISQIQGQIKGQNCGMSPDSYEFGHLNLGHQCLGVADWSNLQDQNRDGLRDLAVNRQVVLDDLVTKVNASSLGITLQTVQYLR